jgi:hypothetical protein
MRFLVAALVLAGLAVPAGAHPPRAARIAPSADLDRLVAILVSDATMLDLAMKGLASSTPPDDIAALYSRNPGMKPYVEAQLRPEMQRLMQRELPALRSEIAAILTAELTPAEITDAATFFTSPTGRKLYAAALGSIATQPGTDEGQARQAAINAAMASLQPEDYPALMAFGASGASTKMSTINPRIGAASRAWAERVIAENSETMEASQRRAIEDFQKRKASGGQ